MKYYKGYEKETDRRFFCVIYDELQDGFLRDPYLIEYGYFDNSGRRFSDNIEEFTKHFYIQREIGEAEYRLYYEIQMLITEFYMNQITGGFPSKSMESSFRRKLDNTILDAYKETIEKDISASQAFANAVSDSMKERMIQKIYEDKKELKES